MKYWLMKSEPSVYSIDDLKRDKRTYWDGVRNYQARNFMRDAMSEGDGVLFYHSNAEPSGVAGIAEIVKKGYPDFTAWDEADAHFDPKSDREKPQWYMVDVGFVEKLARVVPLEEIKNDPALKGIPVAQKGSRLSVQPVEKKHFERIRELGRRV